MHNVESLSMHSCAKLLENSSFGLSMYKLRQLRLLIECYSDTTRFNAHDTLQCTRHASMH